MTIHFGNPCEGETVAEVVSLFGTKEFESPTRSTIPMLSMLLDDRDAFGKLISRCGLPSGSDIYLEYKVRQTKGRGKASHTDVMVKSGDDALAIEAKWTEPMYDDVQKWISRGSNESNRRDVLNGWIELLQERVEKTLVPVEFESCTYQMVHRAASAAAAGKNPRLAYFLFKPTNDRNTASTSAITKQLKLLWSALGSPKSFPFFVVEVTLEFLEPYLDIKRLNKSDETSEIVSAALQSDAALFEFPSSKVIQIGTEE